MKFHKAALIAVLATTSLLASHAFAGDAAKGKAKSATCSACHGSNGIAQIPMYPNLAGQKEQYLVLQLKAFRSGERKNMVMAPMAAGLSDEDIDNLAAYYASLNPAG
ncbi:cytochrome c [Aliiglaciecola litoralis]|uniref:Cytochrome c n=1 Tax=Aliiglaciecola litoralis TaxID=582857 RepID=A0ABN1LI65_9ALTE